MKTTVLPFTPHGAGKLLKLFGVYCAQNMESTAYILNQEVVIGRKGWKCRASRDLVEETLSKNVGRYMQALGKLLQGVPVVRQAKGVAAELTYGGG